MHRVIALTAATALAASAPGRARADTNESGAADEATDKDPVAQAQDVYEAHLRHRLPAKLNRVIDGAFGVYGLRELRTALPELWRTLKDDPDLHALFSNMAQQYIPRVDAAAYAGTVADSTEYVGAAFGVEADWVAPLCRYLGGAFDGHLYREHGDTNLAYDSRVTGCLPWGPFAFELGFISQRSIRIGLDAAPTSAAGRVDATGFELRIRGFRYLQRAWEVVVVPTDIVFLDTAPSRDDGIESAQFTIDSGFFQYIRYGAGPGGSDRVITAFPVQVVGEQDAVSAKLSATVIDVGVVRFTGSRIARDLYLDAHVSFQEGAVRATDFPGPELAPLLAGAVTAGVDTALHLDLAPWSGTARYRRGLLPDSEFRILAEDRGELSARVEGETLSYGATAFAAYTRTVDAPDGIAARESAGTYGLRLDHGRAITDAIYFTARAEAARSFYADASADVLGAPALEGRITVGIAGSIRSAP